MIRPGSTIRITLRPGSLDKGGGDVTLFGRTMEWTIPLDAVSVEVLDPNPPRSDVQRIRASMIAVSQNAGNPNDSEYVLFTDHEAALAAAHNESYLYGKDQHDEGWNAALDAVGQIATDFLATGDAGKAVAAIQGLRRTPPQPEPLRDHAPDCPANPINCAEHMNDDYGHTARCTLSRCTCGLYPAAAQPEREVS